MLGAHGMPSETGVHNDSRAACTARLFAVLTLVISTRQPIHGMAALRPGPALRRTSMPLPCTPASFSTLHTIWARLVR
jgi:hypothetical protein